MIKRGIVALIVSVLCTLAIAPSAFAQSRIVGGSDADQAYPFVVSLQATTGKHFCGGSLITASWVVTAAHCVQSKNPQLFTARIGSNDRTTGGEVAQPAEVFVNPSYKAAGSGGDIALVRLTAPAKAAPIKIAKSVVPGMATRLLGWGQLCPSDGCPAAPKVLQQLDTSVVEATRCTAAFNSALELCTDNPGGKTGACYGDSGGPELVKIAGQWHLAGVTSRPGNTDTSCATAPSIYTAVGAYTQWITQRITASGGVTA